MLRLLLSLPLCLVLVVVVSAQQAQRSDETTGLSDKVAPSETTTVSASTSTFSIANPNEPVAVNGRVVRIADLAAG